MGKTGDDKSMKNKKLKVKMYYKKQSLHERKQSDGFGNRKRGQTGWIPQGSHMKSGWGNKKTFFTPGMKGFLCTTNMRERECVIEAYNILNEYDPTPTTFPEAKRKKIFEDSDECPSQSVANNLGSGIKETDAAPENFESSGNSQTRKLVQNDATAKEINFKSEEIAVAGDMNDEDGDDDEDDIDNALSKEIKDLKSYSSIRKFQSVDTGVRNVVFISTTVDDPNTLAEKIYEDIISKGEAKCRNLLRFIPISLTCLPNFEDIKESLKSVLPRYLAGGFKSFRVEFTCRCNSKLEVSRGGIIGIVNEIVTQINPMTFVDLKNPLYTIYVDVVNSIVCISVLTNFYKYRKYNLVEVAVPRSQPSIDKTKETGTEENQVQVANRTEVPSTLELDKQKKTTETDLNTETNATEEV